MDRSTLQCCLIGQPGTGKTHLATALGLAACRQGRRVRFFTAAALVNRLEEAQKQYQLDRFLGQLDRADLLICDELGYLAFSRAGSRAVVPGVRRPLRAGSLLITSNLAFGDWGQVFQGERMTAALLDRLTHRCHIFEMNGESLPVPRVDDDEEVPEVGVALLAPRSPAVPTITGWVPIARRSATHLLADLQGPRRRERQAPRLLPEGLGIGLDAGQQSREAVVGRGPWRGLLHACGLGAGERTGGGDEDADVVRIPTFLGSHGGIIGDASILRKSERPALILNQAWSPT